ncbi:hypothetical protein [Nocardioides sp. W7]|uniref:hypothetical protein n=1 Tax=Nocardioides sp. W7 TaxID=2931390 RepID=UPI001FCFC817|nr:hypothetical protein [Nocardioides sp. W7]
MTQLTPPPAPRLDIAAHPRTPLGRLVRLELRKMVDTRAGRALPLAIALISTLSVIILGVAGDESDQRFDTFAAFTLVPQGFLLPVLGILLVTQEWSQRTAIVTFSQEPHRRRVVEAKVLAALVLGAAALLFALALAVTATLLFAPEGGFAEVTAADFAELAFIHVSSLLQGIAFGMVFLASAPAIVTFFVIPLMSGVVQSVWAVPQDRIAWFELATAQAAAFEPGALEGTQWAQLLLTTCLWVGLPFLIGLTRLLRAEIK